MNGDTLSTLKQFDRKSSGIGLYVAVVAFGKLLSAMNPVKLYLNPCALTANRIV